jgi:glycosyltransferase involved in cell wall biosynthesis
MRICIVEPAPSFGGGCEGVVLDLGRELGRRGHTLFLLHETQGSMLDTYRRFVENCTEMKLPGFPRRRLDRALGCVMRIGRFCRAHQVNVVLSSHLGFLPNAGLTKILFGVPWLFHLGLAPGGSRRSGVLLNAIAAGVAPSGHTAASWQEAGWPAETLHVIPNWVDTARFAPAVDRGRARHDLALDPSAAYVLCLGRISRDKGILVLLDAFGRLSQSMPELNLLLVGPVDPGFLPIFERACGDLGPTVARRILIRPPTPTPEAYFAAADIACFPSITTEAFGLALVEAMSCGLPVVASRVGMVDQIVGNKLSEVVVPPAEPAAIADRLRWWLENPTRARETGEHLRERVLAKFAQTPLIDRYEALLNRIAA